VAQLVVALISIHVVGLIDEGFRYETKTQINDMVL